MKEFAKEKLVTVDATRIRAFAQASGDHNPIHLDESVAKSMGLPGVIAHGMLVADLLTEWLLHRLEKQNLNATPRKISLRFRAMTLQDETVFAQARLNEKSGGDTWHAEAVSEAGEVKLSAEIVLS